MALKIDIRKDPFYEKGIVEGYEKGIEKGIEKGKSEGIEEKARQIVINLLNETSFEDKIIASLAGVTFDFVQKIRNEMIL